MDQAGNPNPTPAPRVPPLGRPPLGSLRFSQVLPWLVLLVGLLVTVQLWRHERNILAQEIQGNFDFQVQQDFSLVEQHMRLYQVVLRGTQGLFAASVSVERDEFRHYVEALQLDQDYPGVQGIGFVPLIPAGQMAAHVAAVRAEVLPSYTIRPAGQRDFYAPVLFREPVSPNNQAEFGFDMAVDRVRWAAMEQARDSGAATLSGKVTWVGEADGRVQDGVLLYLPVYLNGSAHATRESRGANLLGWVYAEFRMEGLMAGLLGVHSSQVDLEIFDGSDISLQTLLFDADGCRSLDVKPTVLQTIKPLYIGGHTWTVLLRALPGFEGHFNHNLLVWVGVVGVGLSLLLSLITWRLVTSRARAMRLALELNRELVESEAALFIENNKNATLLRTASDGIHVLDLAGNVVQVNDAFCCMLGYSETELLGMNLAQWDPHLSLEELKADLGGLETGALMFETNYYCRDQRLIPVELNIVSVEIAGRQLWYCSARNISARKRTEQDLRATRDQYQRLLSSYPSMIYTCQASGNFDATFVTDNISALLGYEAADFLGPGFRLQGIHPEDLPRVVERLEQLVADGPLNLEYRFRHQDGSWRWMRDEVTLVVADNGDPIEIVGFWCDITDKHNHEEHSRQAQKREAVSILAGGMAHDFNNILQTVIGFASLAKMKAEVGSKVYSLLEQVEENAERAIILSRHLTTLSRSNFGVFQRTALSPLVREAVQAALTDSAVVSSFQLPGSLPLVDIDPSQMQLVISHLTSNAREAMPRGGLLQVTGRVFSVAGNEGRLLKVGDYLQISFQDNGPGISPENLPKVFDPYFTTKEMGSEKGQGLGLALCFAIMNKHHGLITAESPPGEGAVFHLFFPVPPAEPSAKAVGLDAPAAAAHSTELR